MFDRYEIKGTEYVPYEKSVTINEHRAPTDESIKIFNEIKAKAYESIIDTIVINDNLVNIAGQVWRDNCEFSTWCGYKFLINGKEYKGKFLIDEDKWKYSREEVKTRLIEIFIKALSIKLAFSLMGKDGSISA